MDLYLDQQAIDTTTPIGRLMFQVTGAFAEFERSMIRQRVRAGLKRAVDAGKQLGRTSVDPDPEKRIQSQLRAGKGILKVAAECGVGSGTVQRIKREIEKDLPLEHVQVRQWRPDCRGGALLGETDKDWFGDRVAWADKNRSLIERIAADPVATFQEWRDVDKPFAFVAACRELVAADDPNFITHLPISFDGRANGIAHLALIAKDRAAAETVNLLESDDRHDIYSQVVRRLRDDGLQECFSDLTDKELRALVKRPVMTYSYSVTEQGMSRQIYEEYEELRQGKPPKGTSLALAKQIEAVLVVSWQARPEFGNGSAILRSRVPMRAFLQRKSPTNFRVINRYEEPLTHELHLKMRKSGEKTGKVYRSDTGPRLLKATPARFLLPTR